MSSTIVLITGANSGIGLATSRVVASASEKYHILMASRSLEKGKAAVDTVQAAGIKGKVSSIQLDVTDQSSIAAAVKQVEKDHGHLDVLVNNAGVYSKVTDFKKQLEDDFSTNVIGAALVKQAFEPLLLKSSNPYLLHISSALGSLGLTLDEKSPSYSVDATAYRMSKAALNMLVAQDSKILGKKGVKVFAICPGLVESNLRGTSPQEVNAGGMARSADESGQTILEIIEGRRESDIAKFVHKDGLYPW